MKLAPTACAMGLIWLIVIVSGTRADEPVNKKTALDEYIAKPDPTYSWKLVKTIAGEGYSTFVVELNSQTWRSKPEVDRPLWQHWLVIIKPHRVLHNTALLRIGGGRNGTLVPERTSPQSLQLALNTGTVVADLGQVPNQPLIFNNDGKPRVEDDLVAYCWNKYMDTGDATWLPRLPMVKSAVRAMDTVTEFLGSEPGGKVAIKKFIVSGGSKRGWTTWLTAAVDPRVAAIVPAVIDVVHLRPSMSNHYAAYGFWAPAIGDYTRHKITERMDTPEYAALLKLVDPYFYRDRFTMPKFIVNASGDQFFTPDSSQFYFDDLPGVKYLRYVPNANHSLRDSDAMDSITAFSLAILKGKTLPTFSWKFQDDGSLRVETKTKPAKVFLWQANNPKARDFRLESIGPAYKQSPLPNVGEVGGDDVYIAKVPKPAKGWTAYYVELVFDSGETMPYKFTTSVGVTPNVLPHNIDEYRKTIRQRQGTANEKESKNKTN